jgi:hypothetical protein
MYIQTFGISAIKITAMIIIVLSTSACVDLDRMLNPITGHTKHYSFTYADVVRGGVVIGGLTLNPVDSESIEVAFEGSIEEENFSNAIKFAIKSKRAEYSVRSAESLISFMGNEGYAKMIEQYQNERWIDFATMAEIRDQIPERYVMLAQVESTDQYLESSVFLHDKEKKDEDEYGSDEGDDAEEVDNEEELDVCTVSRKAWRVATLSSDVFDLAQDIIVWSGTREGREYNSEEYETDCYEDLDAYPYPDFPSWYRTFGDSASGLSVHLPHKKD